MRTFIAFVRKEFYHIFRDYRSMLLLLFMPVVLILIFGFALTNEVKNARIGILDLSRGQTSSLLSRKLAASRYFDLSRSFSSEAEIEAAFQSNEVTIALIIPSGFDNEIKEPGGADLMLIADATDPNKANTLIHYASSIIRDFQNNLPGMMEVPLRIQPEIRMLYNPQLEGAYSFVPGVMAMVLMLVCTLMTAVTIVREKEYGTMEVLLVSPLRPFLVLLAKAVPYVALSMINIASILLLSVFVLDVPIEGNLWLLLMQSFLFILTCLAFGLFISTLTNSQQVAMFIALIGIFLPTVLLSGFMFPIENMPWPLQVISNIVPAKWFYIIVREIMIKGLGLMDVWKETLVLTGMLVALWILAMRTFKIRLV